MANTVTIKTRAYKSGDDYAAWVFVSRDDAPSVYDFSAHGGYHSTTVAATRAAVGLAKDIRRGMLFINADLEVEIIEEGVS